MGNLIPENKGREGINNFGNEMFSQSIFLIRISPGFFFLGNALRCACTMKSHL